MEWTEDHLTRLRKLWPTGMSTKDIGDAMGFSKNAIVGKAHRLGLPGRPSPIRRNGEPRAPRTPRIKKAEIAALIALPVRDQQVVPVAVPTVPAPPVIAAVKPPRPAPMPNPPTRCDAPTAPRVPVDRTCVFPMWGNGPAPYPPPFCDAPVSRGGYCEIHAKKCFVRVPQRREDAHARFSA